MVADKRNLYGFRDVQFGKDAEVFGELGKDNVKIENSTLGDGVKVHAHNGEDPQVSIQDSTLGARSEVTNSSLQGVKTLGRSYILQSTLKNSTLGDATHATEAYLENTTVGAGSYLSKGTMVKGSTIGDNCRISSQLVDCNVGKNCNIMRGSEIAHGVDIPDGAELDSTAIASISPKVKDGVTYTDNQFTVKSPKGTVLTFNREKLEALRNGEEKPKGFMQGMFMDKASREREAIKREVLKNPKYEAEFAAHQRDVERVQQPQAVAAARDEIAAQRAVEVGHTVAEPAPAIEHER